jgi:hypothetical protein
LKPCHPQAVPPRTAAQLRTLNRIDARIRQVGLRLCARETQFPALIARDLLERAEYPQAFPHLLMSAGPVWPAEPGDRDRWCLSPAVCYHVYAQLAGRALARPAVTTARGRCFRAEDAAIPGVRQVEFEMREIVLCGPAAWVDAGAEEGRLAIEALARQLGLTGQWQPAEDPFYLPAAEGKAVMQRLLKVKLEYQWRGPGGLALASVNRHGDFFGRRFDITTQQGRPAHTACIAVGLDRWAHAQQHRSGVSS